MQQLLPLAYGLSANPASAFSEYSDNNLTVALSITTASGARVADITFGGDGCDGRDPTEVLSGGQAVYSGYGINGFYHRSQQDHYPAGLWGTIYGTD